MEHRARHQFESGACRHCGLVPLVDLLRKRALVVADSKAMRATLRRAARFASSSAPVAIFGESGTGKEVVARVLHTNSPRALKPFVAINVAALPTELLESELFGHARGAFTGAHRERQGLFEEANGGTLFLDEIGEMPLPLQAKLLRALQGGEVRRVGGAHSFAVDVRVVSATHRDLPALVKAGTFREDLLYRLKVLTLRVPPLRERPEDILVLARHFLDAEGSESQGFSRAAEQVLTAHSWPGNVRELANAVQHGAALANGEPIEPEHLPEELLGAVASRPVGKIRGLKTLAEVERAHILEVLEACSGSVAEAARALDIGRNTLWRKLKQLE
ncbi:MAG: sigma-54-dependent Fis family transcriptional regulator [Polyangiaceae bacterium UTPRO1]|jgi:two-component system response regulator HydG|nr:sigma-54 dependent transcriptional regulator [Myxococcales bacterium]OQY65737.1 MAG: sigma-54-dependent Fis family transcriptional regulator [Polyangiaceae bacterium UTPRO1]